MTPLSEIAFRGRGLERPECVLAHSSGLLFAADWHSDGGVSIVRPDGSVTRIQAHGVREPLRPNGIALDPDGSFLLAHLGPERGGVFRLFADGQAEPVVTEVDGRPIPPTNFVMLDAAGRLWITVSTRLAPRHAAARPDVADGFVVLLEPKQRPRIVAEGLGYTNECLLSVDGSSLYVNETFAKATSRFELLGNGRLGRREVVARFGAGTFPDGLALDAEGDLWVTSIVSNRVIRLRPDGRPETVVEDGDPEAIAETESIFRSGALDSARLQLRHGRVLANISSLAFGGPVLGTAFLGCLQGDAIASFQAPVRGAPPIHWNADLSPLIEAGLVDEATATAATDRGSQAT
jgi:sugar lactone lactonase YvrE